MRWTKKTWLYTGMACIVALHSMGCAAPKGKTAQEKRDYTMSMRDKALKEIYAKHPAAKADAEKAPGYAVLDEFAFGFLFGGSGNGYGTVVNNSTKQVTYVKKLQVLPGFGIGGKGYKCLLVFNDKETLEKYTNKGPWGFGGEAEAAFKFGETGGSALSAGSFDSKIKVYQVTDNGIMLRALIPISKYWRDKGLNAKKS